MALLLGGVGVGVAAAAGGPAGGEYAIGDRSAAPWGWWTSCTDAAGRRATLTPKACNGSDCDERGDLFFQRYDSKGERSGTAVRVNDAQASLVGFRVSCSDAGWVAVQWVESGCTRQRTVNPQNHVTSVAIQTAPADCRVRASVAIDDGGTMVAVWPNALPGEGTQIFARRFQADGKPVAESVQVSEGSAGWRLQPKVSIDDTGVALIAWLGQSTERSDHGPVVGRFVDSDGRPKGSSFTINTFGYGANSDPAIRRLGGGTFEVAWTNPLEGGRLAREVRASGAEPAPLAASAEGEANAATPHFGAPRIVDSVVNAADLETEAGTGATWLISDSSTDHWRSDDDSRSWEGPFAASARSSDREMLGTDGAGVWVALEIRADSADVRFTRSTDDGASWSEQESPVHGPEGRIVGARVRGAGTTWIAAWSVLGADDPSRGSVVFVRSNDRGKTWGSPKTVSTGEDAGRFGFELATDADGTWIAMLADSGIRFVRSTDDGRNWSAPAAVVEDAYCERCAALKRFTRVDLAHGSDDEWLAVFAAPIYRTDLYGRDGEVFVTRSVNGGASWSTPTAVAPRAALDGSPDFGPTIASDGGHRWLAAWISHDRVGVADSLDSDVLVAVSTDLGRTWSTPAMLDAAMVLDEAGDTHVSLTARDDGAWMAGWRRQPFSTVDGLVRDDLVVAVAEATCGNGEVEIGEICDDANVADDDGCDSNCTSSGCGNGVVNAGEACDDGNRTETDGCSTACLTPRCGDGIDSPTESCDDGNDVDTDACPNHCGAPRCGDGIVQVASEDCDYNGRSTASCTPKCEKARCGDGYLAPRVEACDDGNAVNGDACPNDCSRATCGDGVTSLGWEECDPAEPFFAPACTRDCRLVGLCGDADADGEVTTADASRVLKRAVDSRTDCPRAACDMNARGGISAADALMDLRKAVGITVGDKCSIGSGTIVFWIDDTREIGAFQIDIDYSSTGGEFSGSGDRVACSTSLDDDDALAVFNDDDWIYDNKSVDTLHAALIALRGFGGRVDLFRCEFEMPEDRTGAHFAVRVVDATDVNFESLDPPPLVGYRVE